MHYNYDYVNYYTGTIAAESWQETSEPQPITTHMYANSYSLPYNQPRYIPKMEQAANNRPTHEQKRKNLLTVVSEDISAQKLTKLEEPSKNETGTAIYGRDASYPQELNQLIEALRCNVCRTTMNSISSAKDHYESRPHDRGLSAWLKINYTDKGIEAPAIKRFWMEKKAINSELTGNSSLHCELCDLKLTSLLHAKQHYGGRKHQQVLTKQTKPSGAGYYDDSGKWVRTGSKVTPKVANDGRFGIGEAFKSVVADTTTEGDGQSASSTPKTVDASLFCKVCDIAVTSATQMVMHEKGSKHQNKLKASSSEPITLNMLATSTKNSIYGGLFVAESKEDVDWSMYRTPTGSFYCETCNISMGHETALEQHLKGKKHLKCVTNTEKPDKQENKTN